MVVWKESGEEEFRSGEDPERREKQGDEKKT